MTIKELKEALSQWSDDTQVMILDGNGGSGYPRDINCGPVSRVITYEDVRNCADCGSRAREQIVVLGFGNY